MPDCSVPSGFRRGWLAASVVSAGVLLTLTHIPQAAMPRFLNEHMLDKVEHVLAYGWVALLFLLSVRDHTRLAVPMIGLLVLAGMGILDETTQPLVNRIASVGDYASDVVGILLALLIFLVKRRFRFDTTAL